MSQGHIYYLESLYRCNGEGQGEIWWCGDQSADTTAQPCQSDVGTMFSMTSIGTLITPIALGRAATVTSSQTNTITVSPVESTTAASRTSKAGSASVTGAGTSTSALTSSDSPSTGNSSALGLGLPLIAAIVALTYVVARRKTNTAPAWSRPEKQPTSNQQLQAWPAKSRAEELYGKQIHKIAEIPQSAGLAGRES